MQANVSFWHLAEVQDAWWRVPFLSECVAKLDEKQRPDNNRIGTNTFLNQYFALTPDLESMLLAWARKIVLQHILSKSGGVVRAKF